MTTINSLPNEVLQAILRLRAAEPKVTVGSYGEPGRVFGTNDITALLPVLQVCRRWRDVGLPLVGANVGANLRPFSTALRTSGFGLHLRSLTLKGPPKKDSPRLCLRPHLYDTSSPFNKVLRDLTFVLDSLSLLHTFSISIPLDKDNALVSEKTLHRLLSKLPPSVENLEVDTRSRGSLGFGSDHGHLCPVLHAIFPHMKYVKLHIAKVCPSLFEAVKTSNLQLVVFPKLEGLFIDAAYLLDEQSCRIKMADLAKPGVDRFSPKLRFLRAALVATGNNTFPELKQLSVFDDNDRNDDAPGFYEAAIKRDKNTHEAYISPVIQDESYDSEDESDDPEDESDDPEDESDDPEDESDDPEDESDDPEDESDDPEDESDDPEDESDVVQYIDAQGVAKEFGQRSRLMGPTGGPAWIESPEGARSPTPFDSDNSASKFIYKWKHPQVIRWIGHVVSHSVMVVIAAVLRQQREAAAPNIPLAETMSVTAYDSSDDRFVRVAFYVGWHLMEAEALQAMNGRLKLPVVDKVEEVYSDWEPEPESDEDMEFDSD